LVFSLYFLAFFNVLVVHPHHGHPVTSVFTHPTLLFHNIALLCWKCR